MQISANSCENENSSALFLKELKCLKTPTVSLRFEIRSSYRSDVLSGAITKTSSILNYLYKLITGSYLRVMVSKYRSFISL